ncbi:MAG TPA: TonB-dependent receptor [Bacteroidales bacterium]|nr:TonB-dependent receptor [Bacteroidales bacterium]
MKNFFRSFSLVILLASCTFSSPAQVRRTGVITGKVIDGLAKTPVEYANIVLRTAKSDSMVTGTVTDSAGAFRLKEVPFGNYLLEYSFIGYEKQRSSTITLDARRPKAEAGTLVLTPSTVTMNEVTITSEKTMMINKIDRKVFNVQKDIQAQTGTVTDLLQNIPSVSVDMDGNISLRGAGNVTILINGRPSVMSGAASLEQMQASLVERIEVITNPSARFRPDGTAGIINIILKKERKAGFNGTVGLNAGNHDRFNGNVQLNYNLGKLNLFGSYGYRQDYRERSSEVRSRTIDTTSNTSYWYWQSTLGWARPKSHIARAGFDWAISNKDAAGMTAIYNYRKVPRHDTTGNFYFNNELLPSETYLRRHDGNEKQNSLGITAFYEHFFNREKESQLKAAFDYQLDKESEDDYYTNVYSLPLSPDKADRAVGDNGAHDFNFTFDASTPLGKKLKLEAGYEGDMEITTIDQSVEAMDPATKTWAVDTSQGSRFHANQSVHALYATLSGSWKKFRAMAGLRAEEAILDLEFRTIGSSLNTDYFALYPTLHLGLEAGKGEWQLNYSKRVNRPDGEDMNPVPEYRDPRNVFIGNPNLRPEEIHSVELGYALSLDKINLVPTLFYRYKVNGFAWVTRNLNDSVLATSPQNLDRDQSAGIDLSGTLRLGKAVRMNFSASGFYSEIDASGIGYSKSTSTFAWNAKLNASVNLTKTTLLQVNGQYRSEALTAQGKRKANWVVNLGFRQDLWKKKISLIATVSDLFNTQAWKSSINTVSLVQESTRRRDARVIYGGIVFNFGTNGKKQKETKFEFDNGMEGR